MVSSLMIVNGKQDSPRYNNREVMLAPYVLPKERSGPDIHPD